MPTADELLKQSSKHLAIIGKFSIVDDHQRVNTFSARDASGKLSFELRYSRDTLTVDDTTFEAYSIFPPRAADRESDPLPISRTPLEQALANGQDIAQVGGRLYGELLNSLDKLAPYWSPKFDRQICEGFLDFTRGVSQNNTTFADTTIREAVYSPAVNRALLTFIRARETETTRPLDALKTELAITLYALVRKDKGKETDDEKENSGETKTKCAALSELLITELIRFRANLGSREPDVDKDKVDGIPGHDGKSLAQHYRVFRQAAEGVENISRCEPLIALMIMWYFRKVTDSNDSGEIANAVYTEIYEKDATWKPRLSSEQQDEDQESFRQAMNTQYAAIIEEEREQGGAASTRAIVFKLFMRNMVDHRGRTWRVSRLYNREELIADTTRRFLTLAAETIEGVQKLLDDGKSVLDGFKHVYQDFESRYAEPEKIKETLATIFKKLSDDAFGEWKKAFQEENKDKEGRELADAFRKSFNRQVAKVTGETAKTFLKEAGDEIEEKLSLVSTVYRAQLRDALAKPETTPAGGSLGGVRNPRNAEKKEPVAHGAEQEFRRLVRRGSGSTSQASSEPAKPTAERIHIESEPSAEGAESGALSDRFAVDFDEETLKSLNKNISGGDPAGKEKADTLSMIAKVLDHYDGVVETVRDTLITKEFLEEPSKAPSRGTLRSTLLGEFMLTAPDEVSPLKKKDTSLGVPLLLGMAESVGASEKYEGKNRASLVETNTDLGCGVRDAGLPSVWQISRGEQGKKQLEALIVFWRDLAQKVFSVREYIEDMKEVNDLLAMIPNSDEFYLTIVNDTVADHARSRKPRDLFCSNRPVGNVAPPATVFVSRQAFETKNNKDVASLESLATKLIGKEKSSLISRLSEVGEKEDRWVSFPLFVASRDFDSGGLPRLSVTIPENRLASAFLWGIKCAELEEVLGDDRCDKLENSLNVTIGAAATWSDLWKMLLLKDPGDLFYSRIVTHAMFQRCLGETPAAEDAIHAAIENVEKILVKVRSVLAVKKDGSWQDPPPSRNGYGPMADAELAIKAKGAPTAPITQLPSTFARLKGI
jgi:hypothetical protein